MPLSATWSDILTTIGTDGFIASTVAQSAKMNQGVLQNLMYLKEAGFNFKYGQLTGGASIASNVYADINAALNLSFTPRSASNPILIMFNGTVSNGSGADNKFDINVDGSRIGHATYGTQLFQTAGAMTRVTALMTYITTLSAAAHTIKPQWCCSAGTLTLDAIARGVFFALEMGN